MLKSVFSSCFNSLRSSIEDKYSYRTAIGVNYDSVDIDCTVDEVTHLSNLQVGKTSGPDVVSSRMLLYTASSIAPRLSTQWKISLIVPIPNQPISLTCILCKVLEKNIRQIMDDYLNETGQLSSNQGFLFKVINRLCTYICNI